MNLFFALVLPLLSVNPETSNTPLMIALDDSESDDSSESEEIDPTFDILDTRIIVPNDAQDRLRFRNALDADMKCIIACVVGAFISAGVTLGVYFLNN